MKDVKLLRRSLIKGGVLTGLMTVGPTKAFSQVLNMPLLRGKRGVVISGSANAIADGPICSKPIC